MAALDSVFNSSLSLLRAGKRELEAATLSDRTQEELQNLTGLVLSAIAHGSSITARVIPGVGVALISDSVPDDTLATVAKVLAQVASSTVFYGPSMGADMQQCDSIGVPVHIPHAASQVGARHGVVRELFGILASPAAAMTEEKARFEASDSLREKLSQLCSWRIETRRSSLTELVLDRDFSFLSNDEFRRVLQELRNANPPFVLRFEPTFTGVCLAAHEVIGSSAAWTVEPAGKAFLLTVCKTPSLDEHALGEAARCLEARLGATCNVQLVKPDGLVLLPPASMASHISPNCTPAKYLACSMSAAVPNSNIVTCSIPFEIREHEGLKFISGHISAGSSFVKVVSRTPSNLMSRSEYLNAMDELTDRLKLPRFYTRGVRNDEVWIDLPSLTEVANLESLETCISYINSLKSVCAARVEIVRPSSRAEMFSFFARTVSHECEWDVRGRGDITTVYTPHPERFLERAKKMFGAIFGKQLSVVREPEELRGEYLLSPSQAQSHMSSNQFFPAESELILPRGFGETPIIRQRGNRLVVYSMTENLPRAYIDSVVPDLYGISIPVIIRSDMHASLVADVDTLGDIVVRSLPVGIYLRNIAETEDAFVLELSNCGSDRARLKEVMREIARCCSKRLSVAAVPLTAEFHEVMSQLSTESDKRFYALAIDADNVVADADRLRWAFRWLFDHKQDLPREVKKREIMLSGDVRDLTGLHCFSMDRRDTRIREDAFSVESLPGGGCRFGVHVVAGSRQIPHGCPAEVRARKRGSGSIITFGGQEYSFRLFSEPFRKLFDLTPERGALTFSLTFETDAAYVIKPDTYNLCLAEICNRHALSFEQAESLLRGVAARSNKRALARDLQHAQALVRAQNARSSSFADRSALIKPADITQGLLAIFNTYIHKLLDEQEVALPPPARGGLASGTVKFNAPARDYKVLLAQRQLDSYLQGKEPLSPLELQEQLSLTGVAAVRSSAFRLIAAAEELRRGDSTATVVLQSGGHITALGKPEGLTSPLTGGDATETEDEGEGE